MVATTAFFFGFDTFYQYKKHNDAMVVKTFGFE